MKKTIEFIEKIDKKVKELPKDLKKLREDTNQSVNDLIKTKEGIIKNIISTAILYAYKKLDFNAGIADDDEKKLTKFLLFNLKQAYGLTLLDSEKRTLFQNALRDVIFSILEKAKDEKTEKVIVKIKKDIKIEEDTDFLKNIINVTKKFNLEGLDSDKFTKSDIINFLTQISLALTDNVVYFQDVQLNIYKKLNLAVQDLETETEENAKWKERFGKAAWWAFKLAVITVTTYYLNRYVFPQIYGAFKEKVLNRFLSTEEIPKEVAKKVSKIVKEEIPVLIEEEVPKMIKKEILLQKGYMNYAYDYTIGWVPWMLGYSNEPMKQVIEIETMEKVQKTIYKTIEKTVYEIITEKVTETVVKDTIVNSLIQNWSESLTYNVFRGLLAFGINGSFSFIERFFASKEEFSFIPNEMKQALYQAKIIQYIQKKYPELKKSLEKKPKNYEDIQNLQKCTDNLVTVLKNLKIKINNEIKIIEKSNDIDSTSIINNILDEEIKELLREISIENEMKNNSNEKVTDFFEVKNDNEEIIIDENLNNNLNEKNLFI